LKELRFDSDVVELATEFGIELTRVEHNEAIAVDLVYRKWMANATLEEALAVFRETRDPVGKHSKDDLRTNLGSWRDDLEVVEDGLVPRMRHTVRLMEPDD
jgi:hypothetical protein